MLSFFLILFICTVNKRIFPAQGLLRSYLNLILLVDTFFKDTWHPKSYCVLMVDILIFWGAICPQPLYLFVHIQGICDKTSDAAECVACWGQRNLIWKLLVMFFTWKAVRLLYWSSSAYRYTKMYINRCAIWLKITRPHPLPMKTKRRGRGYQPPQHIIRLKKTTTLF